MISGLVSLLWFTARGFRATEAETSPAPPVERCAVRAIRSYQVNVSARRARPVCRHQPSCSAYAIEAIQRHGIGAGGLLTWGRLRRCRPHGGGFDPVP